MDKIRLMHLEDSPIIAKLVKEMLTSGTDLSVEIEHFILIKEGLERLAKGGIDIVLTDLQLPDSDGLNTFYKIYAEAPDIPIVIMTGTYEEETLAIEAVQQGAQEYLRKAEVTPDILKRAIRYSLERQQTKNELKRVNDELNVFYAELKKAYSDLKLTKDKLVQAEKLAGLVRFSEGVAHEIRNPLGIIIGGSEVLEKKLSSADDDTRKFVDMIKNAAVRASDILSTFLVYSKTGKRTGEKVSAPDMLRGILSEFKAKKSASNIDITEEIAREDVCVEADKGQVDKIVTDVLVNSIEAMPSGGSIAVKARAVSVPESADGNPEYVITIEDKGSGISKDNISKLFEPFFTTKERKREGAGRSLFTALINLQSFGGRINIDSVEGKGTTVNIILPCCKR